MLNKLMLIGRLIKDPVIKPLPKGNGMIATFTVATNYAWVDARTKEKKESVEFHSAVCWGKIAQIVQKHLFKGNRVYVEGRLVYRQWKDLKGTPQHRTEVFVSFLLLLGDPKRPAPPEVEVEEVPIIDVEDED